jgi:hypothetical protein
MEKINEHSMKSFEEIWTRILACEGEQFSTIKGRPFTYKIVGTVLIPSRTNYTISKTDFKKTYQMLPIKGPGVISNLIRGPSYVWAILHDSRITC